MDRLVLVHDIKVVTLDLAQTALGLDARAAEVLFRHGDIQLVGQILQFLIDGFGFHGV